MTPDFESFVLARLQRLEAQNRRLKWFGAFLLLLAVAQTIVALYLLLPVGSWLGLPRTVVANRFVLLDERGRVRADLGMDQGPRLELSTEEGVPRASLWVNHSGAANLILLDNKNGAGRAVVLHANDDGTALNLLDEKGARATLAAGGEKASLQLFDEQGKAVPAKP